MLIKTKINQQAILNLNGEQLYALVYNKAVDKYLGTFGERFKDNEQDRLLCEMLACSLLNSDVKNGGFDQFFLNYGELTETVITGLDKINAQKHRELSLLAFNIQEEQKEQYQDRRNPNLDELDEKYYELEDLEINLQKFIEENIEMFYD
jgi:hypothetical protein